MFTSSSPFTIATSRAQALLDNINNKILAGQISTRADLLAALAASLQDFVGTLSEPSLTVPSMALDDILVTQFLTDPISEADSDCQLADEQIANIRDLALQIFNTSQAERAGLQQSLAEVTSLVNELRLWISDSDSSFLWVGDTFNNTTDIDPASNVFVNTTAGVVTLQPDTSVSLASNIVSITIDKKYSEGGIPGNNTEIRSAGQAAFTGERQEPIPVLYRATQPTPDDLTAVLDGNPNTWFEWERVYVPIPQNALTARTAFVYDPGGRGLTEPNLLLGWTCFIRWPGDDTVDEGQTVTVQGTTSKKEFLGLVTITKKTHQIEKAGYPLVYFNQTDRRDLLLGLIIQLDQPRPISWIELTPYLRATNYPQVDQILVSSDGNQWLSLLDTPTVLDPRLNKGVDFSSAGISNSSSFEGVGVWPLPKTPFQYIKVLLRQTNIYSTDQGIGHRYQLDSKGKNRVQPPTLVVGNFNNTLSDGNQSTDFTQTVSDSSASVSQFYDILKADRQVIGIRDLLLEQRTYKGTGQLVSTALKLSQPATAVALLTTESVPVEWPSTTPEGKPWIYYEISTDGSDWQPIVPQVAQLEDSVVKFDSKVTQLYFRATLTRPADSPSQSPILYSYALKVLP